MTNDVIVRPQSPFQEKYLKSNAKILVVGGAAGCLPAETEYLSPTGWKLISEWDGGEVGEVTLDAIDKTTSTLEFKTPVEYVKLPCGEMKSLKSKNFEMTCSDEHKVVFWNDNRESYQVQEFSEVVRRHEASKTKGWTGKIKSSVSDLKYKAGMDITEGDLRLMVMVMADGHFVPEGANNYCQVSISKTRKIDRFRMLADRFGWKYKDMGWTTSERYAGGGIHKFIVWPPIRQKRFNGEFWNCTSEQLGIITDEVRYWDSNVVENEKSTSVRYCSKYKEDADFIQYAFTVTGTVATIVKDNRENKETYTVNTVGFKFRSFANKDGKCPVETVETSDGFKYCFTTESGYFLVRQDGNIFVTGNSSKSYVGLMRHLRWVHDPNYNGFCIRKNSTAIMKAGGLFQEACKLYMLVYPPKNGVPQLRIKQKEQKIIFPSGASISFSHYENDGAGQLYHGLQLSNVFYDEASQASEEHIWWLFSRLRTDAKLDPSIWLSCNPDPDSFLFEWVKWWLYPESHPQHGIADPDKNGITRYLLRIGGELCWGDTPEELIERYGKPDLPMDHEDQVRPIPFQVLLGTLLDNPSLMKAQPDYKSKLEAMPEVEMRRLLLGDWTAREAGSTYFQRSWCAEPTDEPPRNEILRTVRAYDFAGTLKSSSNPSPDYTACARVSKLKNGDYFVHDVQRTRILYGDWERFILDNAARDGYDTEILIPLDPGASAKVATSLLTRALSEKGYRVRTLKTTQSKLDRFRPFSSLAMNGHISFLKGCGYDFENKVDGDNNFVYRELEAFNGKRRGGESGHDDQHTDERSSLNSFNSGNIPSGQS